MPANDPRRLLMLATALAVGTGAALAADTTEPVDRGATDFEMYLGKDGFGLATAERSVGSEMLLGYGITDRVSAFVGAALSADGHFLNSESEMAFGLFGTAFDTRSLDLDLSVAFTGADGGGFTANPSLELNWDASPELDHWGLYTRAGLAISGRDGSEGPSRTTDMELAIGTYWTLAAGRQLLLEFDGAFVDGHDASAPGAGRAWETGGIALGFNAAVTETLEMINQVYRGLPADGEAASFGVMVGFVATLPTGP
ncbi:MAG: hypothetical protein IH621_12465 [Krumholzibacteria bacterium]|nr:hypothetical protein [Candidatus Krumholzibacteria bacterium]